MYLAHRGRWDVQLLVPPLGQVGPRAAAFGARQQILKKSSKKKPLSDSLTLKLNEMLSMEMTDFLAKFCSVPVRKA